MEYKIYVFTCRYCHKIFSVGSSIYPFELFFPYCQDCMEIRDELKEAYKERCEEVKQLRGE